MNFFQRILCICFFVLSACSGAAPPEPEPSHTQVPQAVSMDDWEDLSLFAPGLIASQQSILAEMKGASIYHIDYTIGADIKTLSGSQQVRYTNREDLTLDEIQVRLLPNVLNGSMNVSQVSVEGQLVEPTYALNDSLLRFPLDPGLLPGESRVLGFEFSVDVPTEIESNYGILAYYADVLTLAHTYPMIAVYDDEGWNAEIPPDQGDPTYADASFFLVNVDAPEGLVLAASGREVARQVNGSRQLVTFAAGPVRDFYLAASPHYELTSRKAGEVTFNSYAPKDLGSGSEMAIEVSINAFEQFGEAFGAYPYTEYDIVSTPTFALGIEYPGMTAITDRIYDLGGTLSGTPNNIMLESTIAHEAGHQWFYNMVGNDQLDDPWLDESLVQYITWEYYTDQYGADGGSGFEASLRGRWARVENQPIPIGLPVADYQGREYGAIVYGRGAFFFEALKEELGEEAFQAFLYDYAQSNMWGIGTPTGLQTLAEEECGCDLSALFDEWVNP